jgi:hypothetical protein
MLDSVGVLTFTEFFCSQQVDKVFYQTYPALLKQRWRERVNKPLADTATVGVASRNENRILRQEWCAVANKLIEQKPTQ